MVYNYYNMCIFPIVRHIKLSVYSRWEKLTVWQNSKVYENRKYFAKSADFWYP